MDLSLNDVVKYVLEGCAVAAAAFYLPQKKTDLKEVAMIGMVAAITFFVLDLFAPSVAAGTRQGSGFGIGYGLVGGADENLVEESGNMAGVPSNQSDVKDTAAAAGTTVGVPAEEEETVTTGSSGSSIDNESADQDNGASGAKDQNTPSGTSSGGAEAFAAIEPFVSGYASI